MAILSFWSFVAFSSAALSMEELQAEIARLTAEIAELRLEVIESDRIRAENILLRAFSCGGLQPLAPPPSQLRRVSVPASSSLDNPSDRPCSQIELTSVLGAADKTAAVLGMMPTNTACAMCFVACSSATNAVACAQGCTRPMEAFCSATDLRVIELTGLPLSLNDRGRFISLLGATSASCAFCIAETVHSICGKSCSKERLHIGLYDLQIGAL